LCTDPYVPDPKLVPLGEALRRADIFILGAPHSAYRNLHISSDKVIVDVWGFWPSRLETAAGGQATT
ncbi:MAG: hypothetical protein WA510_31875, partial [Acidobacteriaceae bacterium]